MPEIRFVVTAGWKYLHSVLYDIKYTIKYPNILLLNAYVF